MTVLLDLPERVATALTSPICFLEPYQGRQTVLGGERFVGSLEFDDGALELSIARRKLVVYRATAYVSVSSGENRQAERLLVQLCHGPYSWHQLWRAAAISGARPFAEGITIGRDRETDGRLIVSASADFEIEIAAYVDVPAESGG